MSLKRGLFIVIEGPDGVGKSCTIKRIKLWAAKQSQKFVFTQEPRGDKYGRHMRQNLLLKGIKHNSIMAAYAFAAARREHVNNIINPALKQHTVVVCDRYVLSSVAYQGDLVRTFGIYHDRNHVMRINRYALSRHVPDLTVLIHADLSTVRRRLNKRRDKFDRFDKQMLKAKQFECVNRQYLIALKHFTRSRKMGVNATEAGPSQRADSIIAKIKQLERKAMVK